MNLKLEHGKWGKKMEAMRFPVPDAHHRTGFFSLQSVTLATLRTH